MQTLVDRTLDQIRKKEEELVLKNVELQQLRDANSRQLNEWTDQKSQMAKFNGDLARKDAKYSQLKEMSTKCLMDQKDEFEICLARMRKELNASKTVQQQLEAKVEECSSLEKALLESQNES